MSAFPVFPAILAVNSDKSSIQAILILLGMPSNLLSITLCPVAPSTTCLLVNAVVLAASSTFIPEAVRSVALTLDE